MLVSVISACSTLLAQANISLSLPELEPTAQVVADSAQTLISQVSISDCVNVVIPSEAFLNAVQGISESRVKTNLIVMGEISEQVISESRKMWFDVYIASEKGERDWHFELFSSPFGLDGQAIDRIVRAGHVVSRVPLNNYKDIQRMNGGIILTMMEKPLGITVDFRGVGARSSVGALEFVKSGAADVAIFMPTFDWARYSEGLDISPALGKRHVGFLRPFPKMLSSRTTLMNPFTSDVWFANLVTTLCIWCSFTFIRRFSISGALIRFEDFGLSVAMLVYESLPHNWFDQRHLRSFRICLILWMLSQSILSFSYKSNLLSNLIKTDYEEQPETIKDLLLMKKEIHLRRNKLPAILLKTSPVSLHKELYTTSVLDRGGFYDIRGNIWPPPELQDAFEDGNLIGMGYSDLMVLHRHNSEMMEESIYTSSFGYYYSLKFPLKNELDLGLLALQGGGIIQKEKKFQDMLIKKVFALPDDKHADSSIEQGTISLSVDHMIPSFVLLTFALSIGLITFLFEQCFTRWK